MSTEHGGDDSMAETREQTLAQHREIHALADRVRTAADLDELLSQLQKFRSAILAHFNEEESPDGFFEVVRARAGRHLATIRRFEAEHQAFLHDLDGLAERARACLAGPVAEILRDAGTLALRLRDHEVRENEVLLDALYVDLGEEA